jgi:NAD(P)H-hydrate epimerase
MEESLTSKAIASLPGMGKGDLVIDEALARSIMPHRAPGAHKWGVGGLIIVAGAPGYLGAPALSALAAGRVGAGIVLLAVPRGLAGSLVPIVPEAAYITLPEGDPVSSARQSRELIADRLEKVRALLIGPGLTTDDYASALLAELFGKAQPSTGGALGFALDRGNASSTSTATRLVGNDKPAVIDADGLNWLAEQQNWWEGLTPRSMVLTPHVGEMSRLLDCTTEEIVSDPIGAARAAAVRWGQVVVLKFGYGIATDGKRAYVTEDAPVSLASAGTGDVLAGAIGGFLAQGLEPLDAAALALAVGSRAAHCVELRVGTLGLVASDLPLAMAKALRDLESDRGDDNG